MLKQIYWNENLKEIKQYNYILEYLNLFGKKLKLPVKLVKFRRVLRLIEEGKLLENKPYVQLVGPYGFLKYLDLQYNAYGVVSDSGTSQEECPLLKVPVAVPRNTSERPEFMENGCSILVGESNPIDQRLQETINFLTLIQLTIKKLNG